MFTMKCLAVLLSSTAPEKHSCRKPRVFMSWLLQFCLNVQISHVSQHAAFHALVVMRTLNSRALQDRFIKHT